MTALSEQELREIDAEATAAARDLYGDSDSWSAYGCGYKAGVIAERLRQRAGEGRDGLARKLVDALLNMKGAFDTPVERRRRPFDDFQEEAVASMRAALDEAKAAGLLDEPSHSQHSQHAQQPTVTPPANAPALKVEHPALSSPHYWPWPNDQTARDELVHRTVWRWLREQIGESREMATFTVINLSDEIVTEYDLKVP